MMPNCHNGAHSPAGIAPPMQEPTYCQMNSNLPILAQFTPPGRPSRRSPSSVNDSSLRASIAAAYFAASIKAHAKGFADNADRLS